MDFYRKILLAVCLIDLFFVYISDQYIVTMNTLLSLSYAVFGLYALDQNKSYLFKIYYIFATVSFVVEILISVIVVFFGIGVFILEGDLSERIKVFIITVIIIIVLILRISGIYAAYNLYKKYLEEENSPSTKPLYESNYINLDAGITTEIEANKY